jgi:hypothetical protein
MSTKKIIHELDLDSLIALAQGAKPEDIVEKLTEASKFIYELNIKHGDTKISSELIYHTYKHWNGWNQKRQSKVLFFKDFKTYFEPYRTTHGVVYHLNPKPFDLSDETYWLIKKELRDAKTKRQKKDSSE